MSKGASPGYQATKNIAANPVMIAPTATANPRDAKGEFPSDEILGELVVVWAAVAEAEAPEVPEVAEVGPTIRRIIKKRFFTCSSCAGCAPLGSSNFDTELARLAKDICDVCRCGEFELARSCRESSVKSVMISAGRHFR